MPSIIFTALWVKIIIIAGITAAFILITLLNIKTKKPDNAEELKDCDTCSTRFSCPVIGREEKRKEELKDNNQNKKDEQKNQ